MERKEGRWEVLMMSNKCAWREVTSGAGSMEEVLNEDDVQLCFIMNRCWHVGMEEEEEEGREEVETVEKWMTKGDWNVRVDDLGKEGRRKRNIGMEKYIN